MQVSEEMQRLGKYFKTLMYWTLLYPIERFQIVQQVQHSYIDPSIRDSTHIKSESVRCGIRSYFRGSVSSFLRKGIICSPLVLGEDKWYFGCLAYLLVYPLEVINIRITTELTKQRFYPNTRIALANIRKNQGLRSLFRGSIFGTTLITAQSFIYFYNMQNLSNQSSFFYNYLKQKNQEEKALFVLGIKTLTLTFFHPLQSLLRLNQMNGAVGHTDKNYSIRTSLKHSRISQLYRGLEMKLLGLLLFTGIAMGGRVNDE